jgi:hypothetical protein
MGKISLIGLAEWLWVYNRQLDKLLSWVPHRNQHTMEVLPCMSLIPTAMSMRISILLAINIRPGVSCAAAACHVDGLAYWVIEEQLYPRHVGNLPRERGAAIDLSTETERQLKISGADTALLRDLRTIRTRRTSLA